MRPRILHGVRKEGGAYLQSRLQTTAPQDAIGLPPKPDLPASLARAKESGRYKQDTRMRAAVSSGGYSSQLPNLVDNYWHIELRDSETGLPLIGELVDIFFDEVRDWPKHPVVECAFAELRLSRAPADEQD